MNQTLMVSFRFVLEKSVDSEGNIPESEQIRNAQCVADFLRNAGATMTADQGSGHDVVAVGTYGQVKDAFKLAIVAYVEPGCEGSGV